MPAAEPAMVPSHTGDGIADAAPDVDCLSERTGIRQSAAATLARPERPVAGRGTCSPE